VKKKALITGITGQDGSYLAELLLREGYEVHGIVRKNTLDAPGKLANLENIKAQLNLHETGMDNILTLEKLLKSIQVGECYHLAAPSFVSYSLDDEFQNFSSGFQCTHTLFSALKETSPKCKAYFAGSSEMFGNAIESPQDEETPYRPRSLYGISKLASYHLVRNYREKQNLFVSVGILFNHESPRRGHEFVTRKISFSVAGIKKGLQDKLALGNLYAKRDWGYAPEYAEAMWKMLQVDQPDDFVIATGTTHTVREFVEAAFSSVQLDYREFVTTDPRYFRPSEQVSLIGDPSKAKRVLGWSAKKPFQEMINEMVQNDLAHLSGVGN